jgi:hypothetical protein
MATGIEGTAMKKLSFRHGKLIVAAVAQIIWSSLDDTSTYVPVTDPRMPTVMHFDANGEADAFLVGLPGKYRVAISL